MTQRFQRGISNPFQLFRGPPNSVWTCLQQMRVEFTVDADARLKWHGKVNLKHRGIVNGPVGFGIRTTLRSAANLAALPTPPGSSVDAVYYASSEACITWAGKAAENIASVADHYRDAIFFGEQDIPAGGHRFEVWGNSHSSLAPSTDGLLEVNTNGGPSDLTNPYSYLFVTVET
jgi:hypothetical protein